MKKLPRTVDKGEARMVAVHRRQPSPWGEETHRLLDKLLQESKIIEFLMYLNILGWDLKNEEVFGVELQHVYKKIKQTNSSSLLAVGKTKDYSGNKGTINCRAVNRIYIFIIWYQHWIFTYLQSAKGCMFTMREWECVQGSEGLKLWRE